MRRCHDDVQVPVAFDVGDPTVVGSLFEERHYFIDFAALLVVVQLRGDQISSSVTRDQDFSFIAFPLVVA